MTDPIDQACQREEEDRERALKAQAAKPRMQPCGVCYNCDAPLSNSLPQAGERTNEESNLKFGRCFCDGDCRDDYERRERAKQLNK